MNAEEMESHAGPFHEMIFSSRSPEKIGRSRPEDRDPVECVHSATWTASDDMGRKFVASPSIAAQVYFVVQPIMVRSMWVPSAHGRQDGLLGEPLALASVSQITLPCLLERKGSLLLKVQLDTEEWRSGRPIFPELL